ncbi:hypothetical protein ISS30_01730 [bacterium]|nr:hypothetical protein [FCB group bacterium]MBL7190386.1 hypothetical protein [bacterium]
MIDKIIGILIPIAVSGGLGLVTLFLKRKNTHRWGYNIGKLISPLFGRKLKKYENFENRFQSTVYDFCMGLIEGLDADDSVKWKGPGK